MCSLDAFVTVRLSLLQIAAGTAVRKMLKQWDSSILTAVSQNSNPEHILAYSECLHAQDEMEWKDTDTIEAMTSNLKTALEYCTLDDILKFDASRFVGDLPQESYCRFDCKHTRSAIDARARA